MAELEWVETMVLRWFDIPASEVRRVAELWVQHAPEKAARAHMEATFEGSLAALAPRIAIPTGVLSYRLSEPQASQVAAAIPNCKFKFVEELFTGAEGGRHIRMLMNSLIEPEPSAKGAMPRPTGTAGSLWGPLSLRESEVLALITAGRTDPEIATALTIAPAPASRHVHNILGKLGVRRRSEAAAWWATNGESNR